MEVIYLSETLVNFKRTTRRSIPEDRTFHNHRCEDLKSYFNFNNILMKCQRIYVSLE
jgi:hypothetical protein